MADDHAEGSSQPLRDQFERRKDEIRAMSDTLAAYHAATALGEEMAAFRGEAAQLRREVTRRLKVSQRLSLEGLAATIGVTKATAQQILGRRRRGRRDPSD